MARAHRRGADLPHAPRPPRLPLAAHGSAQARRSSCPRRRADVQAARLRASGRAASRRADRDRRRRSRSRRLAVHEGRRFKSGRGRRARLPGRAGGLPDLLRRRHRPLRRHARGWAVDLDVALLPVAGWGPKVGTGHLDPRRAAEAAAMLRPRIAIPIHWGTLIRATCAIGPRRALERAGAALRRSARRARAGRRGPRCSSRAPLVGVVRPRPERRRRPRAVAIVRRSTRRTAKRPRSSASRSKWAGKRGVDVLELAERRRSRPGRAPGVRTVSVELVADLERDPRRPATPRGDRAVDERPAGIRGSVGSGRSRLSRGLGGRARPGSAPPRCSRGRAGRASPGSGGARPRKELRAARRRRLDGSAEI